MSWYLLYAKDKTNDHKIVDREHRIDHDNEQSFTSTKLSVLDAIGTTMQNVMREVTVMVTGRRLSLCVVTRKYATRKLGTHR
jgi:hypothetical protein